MIFTVRVSLAINEKGRGHFVTLNLETKHLILGFHMTSRRPCSCTEQYRKKSFGNLILLLCKT